VCGRHECGYALRMSDARPSTPVRVTPYRNGPYLVRGPFELVDQDGTVIETTRRTIALCRCARSATGRTS
jgi:hypothetical protein